MKIAGNYWQKFVLWATVLSAITGAVRAGRVYFSIAGLFGCVIMGLIVGSIVYGIWYPLIGRRKKNRPSSQQTKWGVVINNLKIIGFIFLVMFLLGILITVVASLLVRK